MILLCQKVRFTMIYQTENFGKKYEYRSLTHERYVIPPHIHEFSEFALTIKGETTVYLNGKKYLLKEKQLLFILPNQIHEYTDETYSFMRCAVFSNDLIPTFFIKTKGKTPINPIIDLSNDENLLNLIENLDLSDTIAISGVLNLICSKLLKSTVLEENDKVSKGIYFDAVDYISKNFRDDIKLSDMAKKLGYHEKYLSSSLHALTGMNFRSFLSQYRINYAIDLFAENYPNKLRISDVCTASGFSAINSFNRAFYKYTGKTPSEYQAELLSKKDLE